jgi:protease-4
MRCFVLACVVAFLGLPLSTLHAAPDTPKKDASAAKPEQKPADKKANDQAKPQAANADANKAQPAAAINPTKKTDPTKTTIVQFALNGEYPEGAGAAGLFGDLQASLASLIQRMDNAATDANVKAVWLKIENPSIGRGKVFELRAAIARVRKAGKPVYAELTTATGPEYLLACACDKIIMSSSGVLIVSGVRAEVTFYKGLLDKLGLQFDALQMGKFKGAAEPLTRNEMSPPLRESYEALVDDIYDDLVNTIAADRHLKDYQVKTLLDQGLFTSSAAKKGGLVDEILYSDQVEETIKQAIKADKAEVIANYRKKKVNTDFSGIGGMMKLAEMFMGNKPAEKKTQKQKIAVVYAVGPIVEGKSKSDLFGDSVLGSTSVVAALKKASEDAQVAAIVLRIDSPGGSATASDLIWRQTVRISKPIIASMGDVAGSGGYYIAMGTKKIFAAPGTLTGSIGVIGGKLVTRGLYEKLGMHTEVVSRGANSGSMSPSQGFTPDERKAWTELLEETYHQFVSKAAEGRKMPYDKLQELAQGRVYTGRMAKKLGLVDELGSLQDAIAAAKTSAGLKADADVELMVLPEARTILEQLFGDSSASADLESLLPEGVRLLRQTAALRQLLSQRVLTWMPYGVDIR